MALSSQTSLKAMANLGDLEDALLDKKEEMCSDEEDEELGVKDVSPVQVKNRPIIGAPIEQRRNLDKRGTFHSARFPGQQTQEDSATACEVMQTSFTEGDALNRSTTGGGLENEIRQIKALLGQLSRDGCFNLRVCSPHDFYEGEEGLDSVPAECRDSYLCQGIMNKTFEQHNEPPILPFKHPNPNQNQPPISQSQ